MNKQTDSMKLIFMILCICGVCFLGYQIYNMSESRLSTETVRSITVIEGVDSSGVFFRTEHLLARDEGGVYDMLVSEWEKLAKNQVVAVLYSDGSDYERSIALRDVERKLKRFVEVRDSGKEAASPAAMNAAIYNSIYASAEMAVTGNYAQLVGMRDTLLSNLLNRETSFAGDTSAEEMIKKLEAERDALRARAGGERVQVRATGAGLFCSGVDGYEGLYTPSSILSATPEQFEQLTKSPPETVNPDGLVGKLIQGNKWYYATVISGEDAKRLTAGQSYTLIFNNNDSLTVDATLVRLSNGGDGRCLAVFFSEYDIQKISRMRSGDCKIVLKTYEGFRVPKRAVRMQDGVEGVYCVVGVQAKFKPITRIYELENDYVCAAELTTTKELFLYDEIIVSGKNLYDGKIVK